MKRAVLMLWVSVLTGCAYFNGIYNAREAERAGDELARKGQEREAAARYAEAAVKAETVLARYPKTRWRDDALYLAGRGAALSDQCDLAVDRLSLVLQSSSLDAERRERARLALARCAVRQGRYVEARGMLGPLTRSRDRDVAAGAGLWAARASIALGQTDSALHYLGNVGAAAAQWELASASMSLSQFARAESLLVLRARDGDYREDVLGSLAGLWHAGRAAGARAIVEAYDRARTPPREKARLHLAIADLQIASEDDSLARMHLLRAQRLAADTVLRREAAVRLAFLGLRDVSTIADLEVALQAVRRAGRGTPLQQRAESNLLLLQLLEGRTDYTGAALFLAAEVARDSLRAPALAHALFRRVEQERAASPLAPKALLAAAALMPDSAAAYRERVLERYPTSPFALLLKGQDPPARSLYQHSDLLLQQVWTAVAPVHADSLQKLRLAASGTPQR